MAISISAFARQPERGYRGFVDWSNYLILNFGFLAGEPGDSKIFSGFTTSHGYQFNNWLYAGGGAGLECNLNWHEWGHNDGEVRFVIPIFAEARLDAKCKRFTPFFSAQIGANLADHGGIYFSPTIGYRFNWGRKCAINFGLGATVYGMRCSYIDYVPDEGGGLVEGPTVYYQGTAVKFTARLGFEFQAP